MINIELLEDVKRYFDNDYSGHDYFHTIRVMNIAVHIAEKERADITVTALAALLHDVDDYKLTGGETGDTFNAVALMEKYAYAEDIQRKVCEIIRSVSFKGKDTVIPASLEGKIVQDADRLDAIGAIGIARAFMYGGNHNRVMYDPDVPPVYNMTVEQYKSNKGTTINHFYEKLILLKDMMNTATAASIAEARHKILTDFLDEFHAEWDGKR